MDVTIWHNPRCSKSRQTLALLEERGIEPAIRLYLGDSPSDSELRKVLTALDVDPREIMRTGEKIYKELALKDQDDPDALIAAMMENPILIERPIVITDKGAALGRPPESVLDIL